MTNVSLPGKKSKRFLGAFILVSVTLSLIVVGVSSSYVIKRNPEKSFIQATTFNEIPGIKSRYFAEIGQISWNDTDVVDVLVEDDLCYLACFSAGIKIVNISDLTDPVIVGDYFDGGIAHGLIKIDDYLFVADGFNGLEILDVHDPTNVSEIYQHFDGGTASDLYLYNNLLLLADGSDGVEIFSVSNPTSPTLLSKYYYPISSAFASGVSYNPQLQTMHVAYGGHGLHYVDLSDTSNPIPREYTNLGGQTNDILALDRVDLESSWTAAGKYGVYYITWSGSWYPPQAIGSFYDGGSTNDLTFFQYGVLTADGYDGIEYIYYYINALYKEAYYTDGGWSLGITKSEINNETIIFVADGADGLEVIGFDIDNDHVADHTEAIIGTNQTLDDTDTDGFSDGVELHYQTDPLDNLDFPDIETTPPSVTPPPISTPSNFSEYNYTLTTLGTTGFGLVLTTVTLSISAILTTTFLIRKRRK